MTETGPSSLTLPWVTTLFICETLEQVAQRGGRCPIPGNIQGQVGLGSEAPDLVEDVPAHCRGVELDDL